MALFTVKPTWTSVALNTAITALAAFLATIQVVGLNKAGYTAGLSAVITVVLKTLQKATT